MNQEGTRNENKTMLDVNDGEDDLYVDDDATIVDDNDSDDEEDDDDGGDDVTMLAG